MALLVGGGAVAGFILFDLLVRLLPSPYPPAPVAEHDPFRRIHEILKRSDRAYALRLESLRRLRDSRLAAGSSATLEKEVLTAAAKLLAEHGATQAPSAALERLTRLAPRVTKACGKAGISLGPNIQPELIEIRVADLANQRAIGAVIAEYQFAELVRCLVANYAGSRKPTTLSRAEAAPHEQ
ncbi:MAG: hypothetical protein ACPL7D_00530 [Candidatus Sumerlaeaceae bacterium]